MPFEKIDFYWLLRAKSKIKKSSLGEYTAAERDLSLRKMNDDFNRDANLPIKREAREYE